MAAFELAVLDLRDVEVEERTNKSSEVSAGLAFRSQVGPCQARRRNGIGKDLSSRLDSHVAMLGDEIGMKAEVIGVTL